MSKLTIAKLDELRNKSRQDPGDWIKVGMSTCGIAAGADTVMKALLEEKEKRSLSIAISRCGCAGQCFAEPLVEVAVAGMPRVVYGRIDGDKAREIMDKHVLGKQFLNDHIYQVRAN